MSESKDVLVDPELKEMIVDVLEKCGTLQNIRAQLRAATYLALEGQQDISDGSRIRAISQTETGILALQLIRDFLQLADLQHTLSVFNVESSSKFLTSAEEDREIARTILDIQKVPDSPLLLQVLDNYMSHANPAGSRRPRTAGRKNRRASQATNDQADGDISPS